MKKFVYSEEKKMVQAELFAINAMEEGQATARLFAMADWRGEARAISPDGSSAYAIAGNEGVAFADGEASVAISGADGQAVAKGERSVALAEMDGEAISGPGGVSMFWEGGRGKTGLEGSLIGFRFGRWYTAECPGEVKPDTFYRVGERGVFEECE